MKIATWNVNSIGVRLPHVLDWLRANQPDVLALQEIKTETEKFPYDAFRELGYEAQVHGQKTYNGVALLHRGPLGEVECGIPELHGDEQARVICGVFDGVRILNLYVPNGQDVGSSKYQYKLDWLDRLAQHLRVRHTPDDALLLLGDFNIAPEDRDVFDADAMRGEVLFSDPERAALRRLLDWGLVDLFRKFTAEPKQFSWWDYRMGAFRRNLGLRIDHILVTPPLAARATSCTIDKAPRKLEKPSDHAPVIAVL